MRLRLRPCIAAVLAFCIAHGSVLGAAPDLSERFFNDSSKVIVFFGDSITHAGGYIDILKALIKKRYPGMKAVFVNRGKSSETLAGLTEGDHPGPRPVLFDRLATELQTHKPDLIFACYGMNDGIYHPYGEVRAAPYRAGVQKLLDEAAKTGAPVILVTPPPFDSLGGLSKLRSAPPYGYKTPYRNYDSVLTAYGTWLMTRDTRDQRVVDIHGYVEAEAAALRARNPAFTLTQDGIHPGADGHRWMAEALYKGLFEPSTAILFREPFRGSGARAGAVPATAALDGGLILLEKERFNMLGRTLMILP